MSDLYAPLNTFLSFMACLLSFLGLNHLWMLYRKSRPCVGETFWHKTNNKLFARFVIFPGHYFTQTTYIRVPGFRLSSVTMMNKTPFSKSEEVVKLPHCVSIPVSGGPIEIRFCITPIPTRPFTVYIDLEPNEKPLKYVVTDV